MGQAKQRGSKQERMEQALNQNEALAAKLIEDLALPKDSKFLGYVIHVPSNDEYLGQLSESAGVILRGYAANPKDAIMFSDYRKAFEVANAISKRTLIGVLFDTGDELQVVFDEE